MGKKEQRMSAYFSQNKIADRELWEYLKRFNSSSRSHFLKYLACLGIEVFEKQQLGRLLDVEEPAPPLKVKRGRKPILKPTTIIKDSQPITILPNSTPEPPLEHKSEPIFKEQDDDIELVFVKADDSKLVANSRANLDNF